MAGDTLTGADAGATTTTDGRTARRDRNRTAVLDAVIELFTEGCLLPNAPMVAERSGVSLRSVFRYFEDTDELVRAAIARQRDRLAPLFELPGVGEGPLEERIDSFVEHRVVLYERAAPLVRAATARRSQSPRLGERVDEARRELRAQLALHFAAEVDAAPHPDRLLAAVDAVTQFETLELWRLEHGLSIEETAQCMRDALRRLLGADSFAA
jgi:AcrR family transcriptional regulator